MIAPAVLDRPPAAPEIDRWSAGPAGAPLGVVLAVTAAATVAFGVAAEPLLRVAERATVLAG